MSLYFAKLSGSDAQFPCMQLPSDAPWKAGHVPEWNGVLCGWAWGVQCPWFPCEPPCCVCSALAEPGRAAGLCCDRASAGLHRSWAVAHWRVPELRSEYGNGMAAGAASQPAGPSAEPCGAAGESSAGAAPAGAASRPLCVRGVD